MDITNPHPPAPATRPCASPHSAPAAWLRSAAPRPEPAPDPKEELRDSIHFHIVELERLSEQLHGEGPTRDGGWNPFSRQLFLSTLATTGQVSRACEIVDLSKQSAYALRARDPIFAAGWNAAAELARDALADSLLERAVSGSTETVTRAGQVVAERHRHDGRLAMAVLARLDRRCDRSAEEGGAHRRAMAEWDRFLGLVGQGDDDAARDLLAPPPPAHDSQPGQLGAPEPEPEPVWRDPESGEWRTCHAWPGGDRGGVDLLDGRECTEEEAQLLDRYYGSEDDELAEQEGERAAFFAELRAELDEMAEAAAEEFAADGAGEASSAANGSFTSPPLESGDDGGPRQIQFDHPARVDGLRGAGGELPADGGTGGHGLGPDGQCAGAHAGGGEPAAGAGGGGAGARCPADGGAAGGAG
uniref:hypothetical protein n=1 Tax=uncultured Sphingomonas sp. TaxID=158754 RepID=UPI0025FF06EC|nr:hypothetical protein [uncultured Sphingomonas sp.]